VKNILIKSTRNTPRANDTCATIPISTTFQLIARLLLLKMKQTKIKNNIPSVPLPMLTHCVDVIIQDVIKQNKPLIGKGMKKAGCLACFFNVVLL
jgi:hypothetical protein